MKLTSKLFRRLLLAFAGLLFSASSHADESCARIVAQLLKDQADNAEWIKSSHPVQQIETARLSAAQAVNPKSITVERFKAGNTFNYRILASSEEPAIHAYSYEGAVDFISKFASQEGDNRRFMVYLQGFPDDQSLALRQTLRVHINNETSYFLETGPAIRPADLASLVKRHPQLTGAKVTGEIYSSDEMRILITAPLKESASPMSLRVIVKVKGAVKNLNEILARLVKRFKEALRSLPADADLRLTSVTVHRALDRELVLIEKETGISKKDLKIQLAFDAGDIYLSLRSNLPFSDQHLAISSCGEACNIK